MNRGHLPIMSNHFIIIGQSILKLLSGNVLSIWVPVTLTFELLTTKSIAGNLPIIFHDPRSKPQVIIQKPKVIDRATDICETKVLLLRRRPLKRAWKVWKQASFTHAQLGIGGNHPWSRKFERNWASNAWGFQETMQVYRKKIGKGHNFGTTYW
jgi:hypothetical protein